ncbi:MAG: AraC family transcriptional regulator [Spirosomataceae bacterium]
MKTPTVPTYHFDTFDTYHRVEEGDSFGSNTSQGIYNIDGFRLFSTVGMQAQLAPCKTDFYAVGFVLTGSLNVEINTKPFVHSANSLHFKSLSSVFSWSEPSPGLYGYYLYFTQAFIEKVVPTFSRMKGQFPFFSSEGVPFFELNADESAEIRDLFLKMEGELRRNVPNREWMIGTYLFQLFITAHRSYTRQQLEFGSEDQRSNNEISNRFKALVEAHFREIRSVNVYAEKLNLSPSHLNRLVKQQSGQTASAIIQEALLVEAKSLLKYTSKTISEIAFELHFTDAAHFNHFFKQATGLTPKQFRQ